MDSLKESERAAQKRFRLMLSLEGLFLRRLRAICLHGIAFDTTQADSLQSLPQSNQ